MLNDSITLRAKELKGGKKSLYLDIYINGKRSYKFLKLYLSPGKSKEAQLRNEETMRQAKRFRDEYAVQLANRGFDNEKMNIGLFEYFRKKIDSILVRTTKESWVHSYKYALQYANGKEIPLREVTPVWVNGFKEYLEKDAKLWSIDDRKRFDKRDNLATTTKALYFQKFCSLFNLARREGYIDRNPAEFIERFDKMETETTFLQLEEIKLLAKTDYEIPLVRDAFLFSCLTGLRWSDVIKLKNDNLEQRSDGGYRIIFRQQKTRGIEYLDLNPQAAEIAMRSPGKGDYIIGEFMSGAMVNYHLRIWAAQAGIKKHITFHCGRHSFAVMMLELGTDIYTLSKLMGHRDLKSTQRYARVLDKSKQEAVNRIPDIFD